MKNKPLLVATLLVSAAVVGCSKPGTEGWTSDTPVRYCVDGHGLRVPDYQCGGGGGGGGMGNAFMWYYLGTLNNGGGYVVPPIGARAYGGGYAPAPRTTYDSPSSSYSRAYSSSVSRGGFGSTAEAVGGHSSTGVGE